MIINNIREKNHTDSSASYHTYNGRSTDIYFQTVNEDLKREAAQKALSLIHSENIIALNAGTTNSILAEELLKLKKHITVVTNNLSVLSTLTASEYIDLIVPGGTVDKQELSLCGCGCVEELSTYSFDLSFLSINAFHPSYGFSDFHFQEIDIMKAMISHSKKILPLWTRTSLIKFPRKFLCHPGKWIC